MESSKSITGSVLLLGTMIFGGASCERSPVESWAEVLEQVPDPKVVTDADFLKRITETKLPWRVRDKKSGIEMLLVPPGKFVMGLSPGDERGEDDEKPAHEVTITKSFYLGKTEVTQERWVKVMTSNPSKFTVSLECPVETVSWNDCQKFCAATALRLPTEAEWEYACRAGVRTPCYDELDKIAWTQANSENNTHPVGKKLPNALGLYDMLGNVHEWCNDFYEREYYERFVDGVVDRKGPFNASNRVIRGGSWNLNTNSVRSSSRNSLSPGLSYSTLGFRVARTP